MTGSNPPAVLVIGTGLIGTSVGLAATAAGYRVWLTDANREHAEQAAALGAGQVLGGDVWVSRAVAEDPELVVVAVPPSVAPGVIERALGEHPSATITDVSSVKAPVLQALAAVGADLSRVVGGHPMAGRESSGPRAASAELFHGRTWLLTPTPQTDPFRLAQVAALAEAAGAGVRVMPAEVHDQAVALTSHVPQVVASLMAGRLADADDDLVAVAGQGLRDVVRIAGSDPQLWADILATNAAEVRPVLAGVQADLDRLQEVFAAPDRVGAQTIADFIATGNRGAARLPAKHGGQAAAYSEVAVEVPDAPGELGRLFLAAGDADINLEDVRIEHTVGRLTAIAHLYVLPERVPALQQALVAGGWLVV